MHGIQQGYHDREKGEVGTMEKQMMNILIGGEAGRCESNP
jgi:hypothetical protein